MKIEQLEEKIQNLKEETLRWLMDNIDRAEFVEVDTHYVWVKLAGIFLKIWSANGKDSASFYEGVFGFTEFIYTDEDRDKLWNRVTKAKAENGERRNITMTQMSNDLYFSFQGVFEKIKFSGYNDNDWWTKYKPTEIKETDDIVWNIDLEKNVATYKSK